MKVCGRQAKLHIVCGTMAGYGMLVGLTTTAKEGHGKVIVTGRVEVETQESAQEALLWVKANALQVCLP